MKKIVGIMMGLGLACSANAGVVYEMSDSNITFISNKTLLDMSASGNTGTGTMTLTGATQSGQTKIENSSFIAASSTSDLKTLNGGTTITAADTVTISYTVDSSDNLGNLGFQMGFTGDAAWLADPYMFTRTRADGGNHKAGEAVDFWDTELTLTAGGIIINEASLTDGHTVVMTFTSTGWTTLISDIEKEGDASVTTMSMSGTWTGTQFVDNINDAHFFVGGQIENGATDFEYVLSDASVTVIPEPASLGLIAVTGVSVLFIRRRLMM